MLSAILIVLAICNSGINAGGDYCLTNLECNGKENTGCKCDFGTTCKSPEEHAVTPAIRVSILAIHNKYREIVASGAETRGGIKRGATKLYELEYDNELEYVANCFNKRCTFGHDVCRITKNFHTVGQNSYWSRGNMCDWERDMQEAFMAWYEEVVGMTSSCINSFGVGCVSAKVGDFSQMVWEGTTHVGCSLVQYNSNGTVCQIICNYGPAGNFPKKPVFRSGAPGSECKKKSANYKHLCALTDGKIEYIGDDNGNPAELRSTGGKSLNKQLKTYFVCAGIGLIKLWS